MRWRDVQVLLHDGQLLGHLLPELVDDRPAELSLDLVVVHLLQLLQNLRVDERGRILNRPTAFHRASGHPTSRGEERGREERQSRRVSLVSKGDGWQQTGRARGVEGRVAPSEVRLRRLTGQPTKNEIPGSYSSTIQRGG